MAERDTTPEATGQPGPGRAQAQAPDVAAGTLPGARCVGALLSRLRSDVYLRWALAIFLLALALRIAWVATVTPDPQDGRFDDSVFYDASAKALAEGRGYLNFESAKALIDGEDPATIQEAPTARWPIGYPGLVASLYAVFGHNPLAPKGLNVFLGAATVLAVYVLGSRLFDRRVGVVAAALLALFPGQIFFSTLVMTEVLFSALLTLVVTLVILWTLPPREEPPSAENDERPAAYKLLVIGLLLGYGAITRGEGGTIALVVLLIWWLARSGWRPFLERSALLLVGLAVVVAPWSVRNFIQFKAPVFVSTAVGSALWQGNRADAYAPGDTGFDTKFYDEYANVPYPKREVEMNNAALREALDFIVHNPRTEAGLLFKKLYHLYREDAIGLVWIESHGGQASIPNSAEEKLETVANAYYFVVLGWALLSAPLWFSFRDRSRFLLPLTILVLTATHLIFVPNPRYHFAFIPILCVLAARGAVVVWRRLQDTQAGAP